MACQFWLSLPKINSMSSRPVRVRFAPSPTGPLHIGGVRTALFNYLFARKHGGTFILRIEDTDRTRFVEKAESYIIESLRWCGITIDEGVPAGGPHAPYRQSERRETYQEFARRLVTSGHAYYAFDTPEELDRLRRQAEQKGEAFTYNQETREKLNNSLHLTPGAVMKNLDSGIPVTVRFKMPEDEIVTFSDEVRGEVEVNTSTLDDKILLKADGLPTYHLANVADDYLMKITHVIRGEEWLPSTPLHVMLYRSLGWEQSMPVFAHMPLTLKPDGKGKLSKRDGDRLGFPVFPLEWVNPETGEVSSGYRESGYFPEAFINILAFLGWNPGTEQEIFSLEELIEAFSLDRIVKAGSRFDPEKAKWFNHQYMMQKPGEELAGYLEQLLEEKGLAARRDTVIRIIELVRERAFLLPELWTHSWFFFQAPETYEERVVSKVWTTDTAALMHEMLELLSSLDVFSSGRLASVMKDFTSGKDTGFGKVMNPLRLALTGSNQGPGLTDMMEVIGKDEVLRRLHAALEKLD